MNFSDKILNYAKASYPILIINTHEEKRVVKDLLNILSQRENFGTFYKWECINGLIPLNKEVPTSKKKLEDPTDLFESLLNPERKETRSAYVLCDFHLEMESKMKAKDYIRYIKNLANYLRRDGNTLIFVSPYFNIPTELEKEVQVVEYSLPDEKAIRNKLTDNTTSINVARKVKKKDEVKLSEDFIENVVEAAKGMTASEVDSALSLAAISTGGEFNDEYTNIVFDEKIQQIKKSSLLTYIETDISFDDVGGLDGFKNWINQRKRAFSRAAQEYGLPNPKGVLLAGVSGAGKTHLSKAIANEFKVPLFQLDIGKLFASHVGSTESNVREVIKTLEAVGKCCLLIDEIEKSLNVNAVAGQGDGGTSSRMFATLLSWMSDRTSQIFITATSNNHLALPPELTRPGRFDCCFWVDVPTEEERKDIFNVVIKKYKRDPSKVSHKDMSVLAKLTDQYTGAEIEEVYKSSLFTSFNRDREILISDVVYEIKRFKPHALMYPEQLADMRDKAKGKLKIAGKDGEIIENVEESLRSLEI